MYQTAKFDRSPNNLCRDIVLTDQWPEKVKKKKKKNKKSKNKNCISAFASRSKYTPLNDPNDPDMFQIKDGYHRAFHI